MDRKRFEKSGVTYKIIVKLGPDEWDNETMWKAAQDVFEQYQPHFAPLVVEVWEHGGWFLSFLPDGQIVGTANSCGKFSETAQAFREAHYHDDWRLVGFIDRGNPSASHGVPSYVWDRSHAMRIAA